MKYPNIYENIFYTNSKNQTYNTNITKKSEISKYSDKKYGDYIPVVPKRIKEKGWWKSALIC